MQDDALAEFHLEDEAATTQLGQSLSERLVSGDVVLLSGGIGAGKTHLARALIQHRLAKIGRLEDVPSPTFTLVQTYDLGDVEIWHSDLYRLSSPDEVVELGLEDAFDTAIVLIEWPDRLGDLRPEGALEIELVQDGEGRRAVVSASDPRWRSRLAEGVFDDG